ncbi:hypothetical protein COV18_00660 [Candidatus Woesearchaeota archaeon CG10_big_fil_rev_8_21_14_0_10_37_12]|nr:MAG: hypothetical protein COV18_00660 [Candidatus Woesearchaeota archaeon CG10_big_fil_rev_8_21_14_0_10_37_12]
MSVSFTYRDARISQTKLHTTVNRLIPEIKRVQKASYNNEYASVFLPQDKKQIRIIKTLIKEKNKFKPALIVVIGIGGSNLGTIAVQEALLGKAYNLHNSPRVLYADAVDPDELFIIETEMRLQLKKRKNVLLVAVSKSGHTTETIANFEIFWQILKKYKKDAHKHVVVITDKNSYLWTLAHESAFSTLEIPLHVGGRYSVLSPVGLFPFCMLGINIDALLNGADLMRRKCVSTNIKQNPAAIGASIIYLHNKHGRNIYDHFLFATDLESVGKWYRQLMGESIGKKKNKKGKIVNAGITPTVSIGSVDLHSMAQLYLGGPQDKLTNFVTTQFNHNYSVPNYKEYDVLVSDLQKKPLRKIMSAIIQGVQIAYQKNKRPYTETTLTRKDEESVGAFLQLKMIEMMYIAFLLDVNPFDQPSVEMYKKETRRLLHE